MGDCRLRDTHVLLVLQELLHQLNLTLSVVVDVTNSNDLGKKKRKGSDPPRCYSLIDRLPSQIKHMDRLVGVNDVGCMLNLRMDRNTFGRLCRLVREIGGLEDGKNVSVEEQIAMYLVILAHHKKNRVVSFDFWRSGHTVSSYVHRVLSCILKLHFIFLVKPAPVGPDCADARWKCFQGCLGALDGTYINVTVSMTDKPRYRTRKGHISTNTLAVCDPLLRFVYVLPGWEGSAGDSRVLRDALSRAHGLKVPKGNIP